MPLISHVSFPLHAGDPTITIKPARLTKHCLLPGCESPCLPFAVVVVAFTIGVEVRSDRGWVSFSVVQPQATTWAVTSAAVGGFVMASSCLHPMRFVVQRYNVFTIHATLRSNFRSEEQKRPYQRSDLLEPVAHRFRRQILRRAVSSSP